MPKKLIHFRIFHYVLVEVLSQASKEEVIKVGKKILLNEFPGKNFPSEEIEYFLARRYAYACTNSGMQWQTELTLPLINLFICVRTLWKRHFKSYNQFIEILQNQEEGDKTISSAIFKNSDRTIRQKKFCRSIIKISKDLGWGESADEILINGREEFDYSLTDIRKGILETIYQNPELFIANDMKSLTVKGGADLDLQLRILKVLDEGMPLYFPEIINPTFEEAVTAINALTFEQLNEDKDLLYFRNYVKTTELFEDLKEYAFDFYDFKTGADYEFDVETDEEMLSQLDPDAETDSKMSQLADRGALSGMKTMNKKVKFHLSSTLLSNGYDPINAEKAANILIEVSNKTPFKNGKFDVNTFIGLLHDRVENLSMAKDSMEYQTMKAVWDKYFNPSNPNSFLALGNMVSNEPKHTIYYQKHMDVLLAFFSSFSSIKIIEFLNPKITKSSVELRLTSSDKSIEVARELSRKYLKKNFHRKIINDEIKYLMRKSTIIRLFLNPNNSFAVSFEKDYIHFKINGKDLRIPRSEFVKSASNNYVDLKRKFVEDLLKKGDFDYMDFHSLFKAMGFNISEEVALDYLRYKSDDKFEKSPIDASRTEFVQNAILSYLIMAAEMVNQQEINENATPEMMLGYAEFGGRKFLFEVANQRTDIPSLINKERSWEGKHRESRKEFYSPTKFFYFFVKISQSILATRIQVNKYEELIGGTKHNKDKINTPLMERLSALKEVAVTASVEAKRKRLSPIQYIAQNLPNLGSAFYQNKFMTGEQEFSDYFQLQTIESRVKHVNKSFLDFNDTEIHCLLLSGMHSRNNAYTGSSFGSHQYLHPLFIHGDKGPLHLILLNKLFITGYNEKGLALANNEKLIPALINVYNHRFNVARVMLEQIKKTDVNGIITVENQGKEVPLNDALSWDIDPETIVNYFKQVDAQLDKWLSQDETARNTLPQNGVWQKIGGKYHLNRLIDSQLNVDLDSFLEDEILNFQRFAESVLSVFNNGENWLPTSLNLSTDYNYANKYFQSKQEPEYYSLKKKNNFLFSNLKRSIKHNRTISL